MTTLPHIATARKSTARGVTLVETMVALLLMATVMIGFLGAFVQSRRVTESSVLHAACTSLVYGIIEQVKGMDYVTLLPCTQVDDDAPSSIAPPYIRVRINQNLPVWLRVVYTAAGSTPRGPSATPAPTASASDVGAIDNFLGSIPLSTVTGSTSQQLALNLWVWIDEIPNRSRDVSEVKKITIVYTYSYNAGGTTRTVRDREVFLRTRFDQ